jgi:hypothetical protein
MNGTGEHPPERGQPGPEDQKSYVLPHIRTLDQGQTQQGDWTLITVFYYFGYKVRLNCTWWVGSRGGDQV